MVCALLVSPAAIGGTPDTSIASPTFVAEDGSSHSLESLHGQITVVNFWATWCTICKAEMPLLTDASQKYAGRVSFVAVSLDEEKVRPQVWEFARKQNLKMPVWVGAATDTLKSLAQTDALPATLFLDAEGKIVFRVQGAVDKKILEERLRWLTGDRGKRTPEATINTLNKKKDASSPTLVPF